MPPELLGFLGIVVGGILTYLGVRFTARQSRKAAETQAATTAAVTNRQVNIEEWRAIVAELRNEVQRLSGRVETLEKARTDDRVQIARLEADLRTRDRNYSRLIRYVRDVLSWAAKVAPEHSPPPVPDRLAEDLT